MPFAPHGNGEPRKSGRHMSAMVDDVAPVNDAAPASNRLPRQKGATDLGNHTRNTRRPVVVLALTMVDSITTR